MGAALKEILREENISVGARARDKRDVLRQMCVVLEENGLVRSAEAFYADVLLREKLGPTCIGDGVAIPHGKSAAVKRPAVVVFQLDAPVLWESIEGKEEVTVVILFCVSDDDMAAREHLHLLAEVARKLAYKETLDALRCAETPGDVIGVLS
ncbi:MAG: PTS sugar transporter subunit IIA [Coriobacteriaceae bacterium]|nr:PTS sugar transporter subunit IIA [Coriobacteriaceae bacterium]MCI7438558.1 PTS sugar transporter subunit IIA [Coriobacteriaceae bacterium]MDD7583824.1 PTS sugar transporter subunit IIA [Coriobacteriaceae bacterium]